MLFSLKWNSELYIIKHECIFSFHLIIFLMFLGRTNLNLWVSVNACILLHLGRITEPPKKQFKVEILYKLKEFFNFIWYKIIYTNISNNVARWCVQKQ